MTSSRTRSSRAVFRTTSLVAASLVAALFAGAGPAAAQASAGVRLTPVAELRGPFQHVVVGASVVSTDGSVLPSAGGVVTLPSGSRPFLARLFWMGSGDAPDPAATLRLPDGSAVSASVDPASCLLVNVGSDVDPIRYWLCERDVTSALAQLSSIDGEYRVEDLLPSTGPPWSVVQGFVGAFALVIVYVDPADDDPRALQISRGLLYGRHRGDYASRTLLPVEMPVSKGRATVVALEGDEELPADGECTGSLVNQTCDFFGFCDGDCVDEEDDVLIPASVLFTLDNANNPPGNIFNETVSTEITGSVSGVVAGERNALDIDTFDLAGRLPADVYTDLRAVVQTGSDAVLQAVLVVELFDLDTDGDGLSDLQEEQETDTDKLLFDTDGDGLGDGAEIFGKSPAATGSNPTDPLHPDTDRDGLCDGPNDEPFVCVGGEDTNADGVLDPGETNPNDADTDDDGLPDSLEVLFGAYGSAVDPQKTDPLDPDSDDDGLLDGAEDVNENGTFDPLANETDPTNPDTDGGGELDGSERLKGRDPVDFPLDDNGLLDDEDEDGLTGAEEAALVPPTNPLNPDSDGDGLLDGVEVRGTNATSPTDADSDDDGVLDGEEDANKNGGHDPSELDPNDSDTDDDGLPDGVEDADRDGVTDAGETSGSDADTDDDGLCDGPLSVADVCEAGEDVNANGARDAGETSPLLVDSDGDGLDDGLEALRGSYGDGRKTSPVQRDSDGDGLDDGAEDFDGDGRLDANETDPTDPDSDGGGASDGDELQSSTDPLDPSDDIAPSADGGITDASTEDAAALDDAGALPDGGVADGGTLDDAGPSEDGGVVIDGGDGDDAGPSDDAGGDVDPEDPDGGRDPNPDKPGDAGDLEDLELTGSTFWSCGATGGGADGLCLTLLLLLGASRRRLRDRGARRRGGGARRSVPGASA